MEIKAFPKLTEKGAWRGRAGAKGYGGFYSQAQVPSPLLLQRSSHCLCTSLDKAAAAVLIVCSHRAAAAAAAALFRALLGHTSPPHPKEGLHHLLQPAAGLDFCTAAAARPKSCGQHMRNPSVAHPMWVNTACCLAAAVLAAAAAAGPN